MLPDRVSNPGPLTYELGALQIALRGPAISKSMHWLWRKRHLKAFLFLALVAILFNVAESFEQFW